MLFWEILCFLWLFHSWQPTRRKKTMHSCGSFVGQARLQFAGLHSLFLALWCIVIEIGGTRRDLLFWCLIYLYHGVICLRRCFFYSCCICTGLIFTVADAHFGINVSTRLWYSLLQMLFLESMYPQLAFLQTCRYFSSCLSCKLHLHLAFSMTWGCFPQKFCILNLFFP